MLEFLCECGSVQPVHSLLFKPQEVRRKLLLLVEQMDFSKALHLNMVGSSKFGGSPWQSFSQKTLILSGFLAVSHPAEEASCRGLALPGGI